MMQTMRLKPMIIVLTLVLLAFGTPASAFAYQALPVAISKQPTFVSEKSARLNGQANPNEMPDAYQWFEWGISGRSNIVYETPHQFVGSWGAVNTLLDTNADIVGLAPSTQYFYRQIVENGRGRDVGQFVYFTTKALAPDVPPLVIVETENPSSIGETSATLKGYVSPHGNNQTKAWFQWGFSQRLESQTPVMGVSVNSTPIESVLTNLTPGTTYFYRVVGENAAGRTYGAIRVFNTMGTPPPPGESPISQNVSGPSRGGDNVTRTVTTSGSSAGHSTTNTVSSATLPGATMGNNLPGDFLGFFKKATATNTASEGQVAGIAQSGNMLSNFWGTLSGNRPVMVTIENVGPKKPDAHTPIEYRIMYTYHAPTPATNAKLTIVIPSTVIYIGDSTNNELVLKSGFAGERTYALSVGPLAAGAERTVSVLGMTTADAKGFPEARAQLDYDDVNGAHIVVVSTSAEAGVAAKNNTATSGSGVLLPSSVWGWMLYVLLIILAIIGIRKGREYYHKRKAMIEAQEGENDRLRLARIAPTSSGSARSL